MSHSKQYSLQVSNGGDSWTAEVSRKISAQRSTITKTQSGFASEQEAQAWGEAFIKELLEKFAAKQPPRR